MTRGEKVCAFIERYVKIPEGSLVGQPIKLAEFQRKFILDIYDNPAGTRRAYLAIARKNGKTATIACLVLAHLVGPEAVLNSQLVSGARSRDQAALVFNLAAKMVQLSPELSKLVRIVPSGKRLIGLPMNTEYKALAAEGTTAHGLSPVLAILDEVGQVKGPQDAFIDAITTAQGAHDKPLLIAISTQAPTDADLFSIWLDDAERSEDPSIVSHVYTAPEDCALDDEKAWKAANPALGLFRSRRDVEEQAAQAVRMPSAENTFRVLTLNQRVNMVAAFVSASVWKAGNGEPGFDGVVYGGLDLSATTDLTALVLTCREDGLAARRPYFWMPLDSVQEGTRRDKAPLRCLGSRRASGPRRARSSITISWRGTSGNLLGALDSQDRLRPLADGPDATGASAAGRRAPAGAVRAGLHEHVAGARCARGGLAQGMRPPRRASGARDVRGQRGGGERSGRKSEAGQAKATGRIDGLVALAMAEGVEAMMQEAYSRLPVG
jgi:phage terminase large subunit-like protein